MSAVEDIRKSVKEGTAVMGTNNVAEGLKQGKIGRAFVTSNCPEKVKKDISYYAKLSGAEVNQLSVPNDELGVICKKPFSISVIGISK